MPGQVSIEKLSRRHDEHRRYADVWSQLDVLYYGGAELTQSATTFLRKRPKEIPDVYAARVARVSYINIFGTACGWWESSMFESAPEYITIEGTTEPGRVQQQLQEFLATFYENATRRGMSFNAMGHDLFRDLIVCGRAFVLVDLPPKGDFATLQEQEDTGALDPYLVRFSPTQVIDWEEDQYGELTWAVIETEIEDRAFLTEPVARRRWYYFDRHRYRIFEEVIEKKGEPGKTAEETANGEHMLTTANGGAGRIPLRRYVVPGSLWLGNRVYLPVIDHFNADNSYGWQLLMTCLALPVITGSMENQHTLSEHGYIQLEQGATFGYAEPGGSSFAHAAGRIDTLREEILRTMYLLAQARSTDATPAAASGLSKQMDMQPAIDVQNGYGEILRTCFEDLLGVVAEIYERARDPLVQVTTRFQCRGFEFSADTTSDELREIRSGLELNVPSREAEKALFRRAAALLMKREPKERLDAAIKEIDTAPTRAELQAEQEEKLRAQMTRGLAVAMPGLRRPAA
jgi:hypothetical protein